MRLLEISLHFSTQEPCKLGAKRLQLRGISKWLVSRRRSVLGVQFSPSSGNFLLGVISRREHLAANRQELPRALAHTGFDARRTGTSRENADVPKTNQICMRECTRVLLFAGDVPCVISRREEIPRRWRKLHTQNTTATAKPTT